MREEYLKKDGKTKKIYHFRDDKEGIDVRSREVYKSKSKKMEVQFPFSRNGSPKYKYISEIRIEGIDLDDVKGVAKSATFGLGFTKYLNPIIYKLEDLPRISKIRISKTLKSKIDKDTVIFNTVDLEEIFYWLKPLKESQWEETRKISNNALAKLFPKEIKPIEQKYVKNELGLLIKKKEVSAKQLSGEDIGQLLKVLPDHIAEESILYKTEEKINHIRLNSVKDKFKKIVQQKTDTKALEERCHVFFEENSWIFSNILSAPVALLQSKAYVGGKTFENKEGKIADFLYRNSLSESVCIVEIKTPCKTLMSAAAYRKPDVFAASKELSGGLTQVLDQKDNLQKDFYSISKGEFEAFSPRGLLVVGRLSDLNKKQIKSFELFRNNLRDVEIITYDELLERTELVLGQFVED